LKKNKDNKWDIDLAFGEKYEDSLGKILQLGKIEVKTERDKWKDTGNIYVELACRGALSGLVTTKADWWATILTFGGVIEGVILLPTKLMKQRVENLIREKVAKYPTPGGDDNDSIGALIPIKELIDAK
jgi:hypothetical protein